MNRIIVCCATLAALAACNTDKCKGVKCPTGQTCLADSGLCDCKHTNCGDGLACSPVDGKCTDLCKGVTCNATKTSVCNPKDGTCIDKCSGTTCTAIQHCDLFNGGCVDNCPMGQCLDPTTACDPSNGMCQPNCSADQTHTGPLTGNMACDAAAGKKCDPTQGKCVDACALVQASCKYDESCQPPAAACSTNTPAMPGATGGACKADADCKQSHNGKPDVCASEATFGRPGGECVETCPNKTCSPGQVAIVDTTNKTCECAEPCTTNSECRSDLGWSCTPKILKNGASGATCEHLDECTLAVAAGDTNVSLTPADCAADKGVSEGGACDGTHLCKAGMFCFDVFVTDAKGNPTVTATCQRLSTTADCTAGTGCLNATDSCFAVFGTQDPDAALCFPTCTLGQQAGAGSCTAPGYSCVPIDNATPKPHTACFGRTCDTDTDCVNLTANCDLTNSQVGEMSCGKNQHCSSTSGAGTCPAIDKCSTDADCGGAAGTCDTTKHQCKVFCEQANGECFPSCAGITDATKLANACGSGDATRQPRSCSATGACQVACTGDAGCGASAVCQNNLCVSKCWRASVFNPNDQKPETVTNEADVCGAALKCDFASGRCVPPCDATHACANTAEVCDATQHCVAKCSANSDCPGSDNPVCDTSRGLCVPACTLANEATVCAGATQRYCDVVNGVCVPDCSKAGVTCPYNGTCNIGVTGGTSPQPARCNQPCGTADTGGMCTTSPAGDSLYCRDATTANAVCAKKCTAANEATVCDPTGAGGTTKSFCDTTSGSCYPDCTVVAASCSSTQKCCPATGSASGNAGRCLASTASCSST